MTTTGLQYSFLVWDSDLKSVTEFYIFLSLKVLHPSPYLIHSETVQLKKLKSM